MGGDDSRELRHHPSSRRAREESDTGDSRGDRGLRNAGGRLPTQCLCGIDTVRVRAEDTAALRFTILSRGLATALPLL